MSFPGPVTPYAGYSTSSAALAFLRALWEFEKTSLVNTELESMGLAIIYFLFTKMIMNDSTFGLPIKLQIWQ